MSHTTGQSTRGNAKNAENAKGKTNSLRRLLLGGRIDADDPCEHALAGDLMTDLARVLPDVRAHLAPLVGKYPGYLTPSSWATLAFRFDVCYTHINVPTYVGVN